ncbi:MAG: flavin reductase family protein [Clostridia bacterium]|nr:flavin reductase family protein [Clostridia bacterium]
MEKFRKISPEETENAVKLIGSDWMLITSGSISEGYNTMTASWGFMGVLWNKPVAVSFIRPQRFTYIFAEANEFMTLCFFDEDKKQALRFCGSHSGRDCDKAKECGLNPISVCDGKGVIFEEAKLALVCRKIYVAYIKEENILDSSILKNYPDRDFHRAYVCEIVECFERE